MTAGWEAHWARTPHIRFGDPCYACGVPMTPASRRWSAWTVPPGMRKHGGKGLCSTCKNRPVEDQVERSAPECPTAYRSCEYGLCDREAEHQVLLENPDGTLEQVLEVCGLHVTPAVVWGRPWPVDATRVRALSEVR